MRLRDIFPPDAIEILERRAERIAVPPKQDEQVGNVTALLIMIRGEKYAAAINSLTAVCRDIAIIPVPCTPDFAAGIATLRGHLISVLDLAVLLGLERENTAQVEMIVVESGGANIGFRVGTIGDVIEFAMSQLTPVPSNIDFRGAKYLEGILPDGTALLNIKAILDDPRLIIDDAAG